ncbi:hypothetical protein AB1Y20_005574 [Prymnesium parvum]|uniref:Fibronectin type-III domain-containing protein n=1 Tax=Prymnesium parvum TaxID=97485 RepID=A0AB34J4P0_PRYPA
MATPRRLRGPRARDLSHTTFPTTRHHPVSSPPARTHIPVHQASPFSSHQCACASARLSSPTMPTSPEFDSLPPSPGRSPATSSSSFLPTTRAVLAILLASVASATALSAPSLDVAAVSPAPRTAEVSWFANNDPSTFSGFRLSILQTVPAPATYIVQDEPIDKADTSYSFTLERGGVAEVTLEILDLNGIPDENKLGPFEMIQSTTAPDKIDTLTTTSGATNGRYRTFSWRVPRSNGVPILGYTLRKMTSNLASVLYDYNWTCAELSCTFNESISVTIGSDLDPGDGTYLVPTSTYGWKLIARNSKNRACTAEGTCDVGGLAFGTGWTNVFNETQGVATPDRAGAAARILIVNQETVSQTEIRLEWTPPNDNGAALIRYRAVCVDWGIYVTNAWRQFNKVHYESAPASSTIVTGLTPGTEYTCTLSSENSAGGLDESIFYVTYPIVPTSPDYTDLIPQAGISCTWLVDPVRPFPSSAADSDGAPTTAAPSVQLQLGWTAPRPNSVARRPKDSFSSDYYLVTHEDLASSCCRVNRYDRRSTGSPQYSRIQTLSSSSNVNEAQCATACTNTANCVAFEMSGCASGWLEGDSSGSACPSSSCTLYNSDVYPVTTDDTSCSGQADGDRRCYKQRSSGLEMSQRAYGTYQYNTSYSFRFRAWNDDAIGYNGDETAWVYASCAAPTGRPAAPTASVIQVLDNKFRINWTAPNDHGLPITQYVYQICQGSTCGLGANDASFSSIKWMCSDDTTRASLCSSPSVSAYARTTPEAWGGSAHA